MAVTTDGFIGPFIVPEEGVPVAQLSGGSLTVLEDAAPTGTASSFSVAMLTVSGISVDVGRVTYIQVEKKISSDTTWNSAGTYPAPDDWVEGGVASDLVVSVPQIKAYSPGGLNWDFRVFFYNSDGQLAVDSTDGVTVFSLLSSNNTFNAVDDVNEIFEVQNLALKINGAAVAEGSVSSIPPNRIATLEWDDAKYYGSGIAYHDGVSYTTANDGGTALTFASGTAIAAGDLPDPVLANVYAYEVFMYVSNASSAPVNEYPVTDAVNDSGTWYHVRTVSAWPNKSTATVVGKVSTDVICPAGKYVSFWVGARTVNTQSSVLNDVPKYDYNMA